MTTSDDLFLLIKSLSKSEKRYFKLSSAFQAKGEKNKYLLLFDAIEKQKQYDEQKIRKKFADEKFIKQLNVLKHYLYNFILKSLEKYQDNIDSTIRSDLNQAQFLLNKLLFQQSEKMLQKARVLATKYEKHLALLEISAIENTIMRRLSYSTKNEKEIKATMDNEYTELEKYKNSIEYRHLATLLFSRMRKRGNLLRSKPEIDYFKKIIGNDLFSSEKKALSFAATMSFYQAKTAFYHSLRNDKKAYNYQMELVKLFEKNPHQMEYIPTAYHNALENSIVSLINLHQYEKAFPQIEKLKIFGLKTKYLQYQTFYITTLIQVAIYCNTGKFQEGVVFVKKSEKEMREYNFESIHQKDEIVTYYGFAVIFFGAGDYLKANFFLNKILNNPMVNRMDIFCFAKILSILVYYETDKNELLRYAVKSTFRYLHQKEKLYKFENLLLRFIKSKFKLITSRAGMVSVFKELLLELKRIKKDPNENAALNYFDFISWLESKIENRNFAEVAKQKAKAMPM